MRIMAKWLTPIIVMAILLPLPLLAEGGDDSSVADNHVMKVTGTTHRNSNWIIEMPTEWNGTLLLFSHGFVHGPDNAPRNRSREGAEQLLGLGYALAGSSYRATGWSLEEAVPSQIEMLDIFEFRFGEPARVLAYGESMGGLVTLALAERYPDRIDGAMPMCASVSGVVGMMNQALDGAFILRTLVPVSSPPKIIGVGHRGEGLVRVVDEPELVGALIAEAGATPQGRARLALAATLAQLPDWSQADAFPPEPADYDALIDAYASTFGPGVFFPRKDQEVRAGGNASWNTGIDYARLLQLSGKYDEVATIYRRAGLDLVSDLERLANEPRIEANPEAIAYMRENYVPRGNLQIPLLSIHTTGDGYTMVTYEDSLRRIVEGAGQQEMLRQAYVRRPGHCTFSIGETVAAVRALDMRMKTGVWDDTVLTPAMLNGVANSIEPGSGAFVPFTPAPFLRHCGAEPGSCPGEPAPASSPNHVR